MKKILVTIVIMLCFQSIAQTIRGNIYNAKDSLPIPFVNIYLTQHQTGTNTDFNGFFELELKTNDSAVVSCMGYETINMFFSTNNNNQEIYLTPENSLLEEVNVVGDSEKPSHKIMRNVVKNKRKHNPRKIEFLKYDKYTTNLFSIYGLSENFEQKKLIKKIGVIDQFVNSDDSVKTLPILFQETYSRVHQQKNQFQEKVISHNSTGVEFIDVSALTQNKNNDIDIYKNNLLIFDKGVCSPISDFWKANYDYSLLRDTIIDNDTCFHLSFKPKRTGQVGLIGELIIEKSSYRVQHMNGSLPNNSNLNFISDYKLISSFTKNSNNNILKSELQVFKMKIVKNKEKSVLIKKEANFSAYSFPKRIENIDFSKGNLIYDQNYANNKIDSLRPIELDHDSESAIQLHDSLKTNKKFKNIKNLLYMTSTGYYPTKYVEIGHLYKFFSYNRFEKVRLRIDAQTSLRLSKKIRLHAFGGYGFGDKRWKYGADLSIRTNQQKFNIIKFTYKYDIEQLGITENNQRIGATFGALLRTSPMYKLFYHQNANINWNQEWVDGLSTNISLNLSQFEKITQKTFTVREGSDYLNRQKINSTEIRFNLRYAKNEKLIKGVFRQKSLGSAKPIFNLNYAYSPKKLLNNQFEYHKVELSLQQEPQIGLLGRLKYKVFTGAVFGNSAYPFLKIHEGNQSYYLQNYSFNLMKYMEFVSDRYAGFFFEHHLNGLIMDRIPWVRKAGLRLLWTANFVIGSMNDRNQKNILLPVATKSLGGKPYSEVGFGIENIFKVFRLDFVWRLTDNQKTGINHNWGIMGRVQVEF